MSLIRWWPLNGDKLDRINNIELISSSSTYTFGKNSKALQLNAVIAKTPNPFIKLNDWSISFWLRDDGSSAWSDFICFSRNLIRIELDNATNWRWYVGEDGTGTTYPDTGHLFGSGDILNSGAKANTWYHVSITKNGTTAKFYLNGSLIKTSTSAKNFTNESATMYFNSRANETTSSKMSLSDVKCFDHTLSTAEVKELSKGLLVHYNFEQHENLFDVEKYLTSSCVRCTLTPYGKTGFTFTSSGSDPYTNNYSSSLNASAPSVIKFPVVEGQTYCISWRHVEGLEFNKNILSYYNSSNVCVGASAYTGWSLTSVGNWRYTKLTIPTGYSITQIGLRVGNASLASGSSITIDNVMMTTYDGDRYEFYNTGKVIDNSGFGHDADLYNRCYFTSDTSVGTCSLRTYGNTSNTAHESCSYIMSDLGQNITPTAFTISMWAKVNAFGVSGSGMFSLNVNNTATGYLASTFVQYDNHFRLNVSGNDTQKTISKDIIVVGQWHHYAFTWDGTNLIGYRDGVQYGDAVAASVTPDPFRYIILGYDRAGGVGRDSDVTFGEFKLYMTALKAEDIAHEAKSKTLISNKGDIETHEFIEDQNSAQITKNYLFNCSSINEGIDGYALLEYIESSGTQSLNTKYTWNSENTLIVADINPITVASGQTLFGNEEYYSGSGRYFSHIVYKSGSVYYYYLGTGSGSSFSISENKRQLFESFTKGSKAYLRSDGVMIQERSYDGYVQSGRYSNSADSTKGYNHIFSNYNTGRGGILQYTTKMRMYRFTMYDDGVMVRDIVPCKRINDGSIGAYDLVTESFLPNAGTGTFIAGPVLSIREQATINKNKNISGRNLIEI